RHGVLRVRRGRGVAPLRHARADHGAARRVDRIRVPGAGRAREAPVSGRPFHEQARLFWWKWRYYERNERAWRKLRLRRHMLRRDIYVRVATSGDLLAALDAGRD